MPRRSFRDEAASRKLTVAREACHLANDDRVWSLLCSGGQQEALDASAREEGVCGLWGRIKLLDGKD
jgi:hypothetical protein